MIRVTPRVSIDENEFEERFLTASGPGGQNVNKVSSAVELRWNLAAASGLPDDVLGRLIALGGHRVTREGVLIINAQRFRDQPRNRADARDRLIALVRAAAVSPIKRRPTRPTKASQERRLTAKATRATTKRARGRPGDE